ncbi:hypothetical protein, partial [Methanoculleus sp.]|uniref:beta strand repeat-containing protein n=1 Tax=Methanoculleus sp. TaxID=90427 RepID=UPI0025CF19EE
VAATASLRFTGEVFDGETISLGQNTYEFDIGETITPGNIPIDISGDAVAATGIITATQPVILGKKVTIGTDDYTIDDESGDFKINVGAGTKVAATGTLSLTGAITPGSHAETVLTSTGVAPTPITQATKVFNFTGVASDGETITLGARTYEFDNDSSISPSNVLVDISTGTKSQATTKFSLALPILDGETVSIGDEVYEFDIDGSVASGNKAVDVSDFSTVSQGTITISGTPTDQEKMTIGDVQYTFVTSRSGAGEITIDADNDIQRDNIISAINADSTDVTAQSGGSGLVTVLAVEDGAAGNLITFTENVTGLAMNGSGTLGGTQEAIDCDAIHAVATLLSTFNANTAYDITGVADGTNAIDFTADTPGDLDGSLGNISASTITDGTISNFSGGADATGIEAAIALVATVAADIIAAPEIVNVTAEAGGDGEFTAKALTAGTVGNAIVIGETTANGTFAGGATLLSGGLEADTVTIGSTEYTAVASLSAPTVANEVMIGASAAEFLDNLKSAVNQSAGSGSAYSVGTVKNPIVVATDNADTTQKFIAREPGTAANTANTTTTAVTLSFEDTTLGGGNGSSVPGVNAETVVIGGKTYSFVDVLSETNGATAIVNQVLFGADSTTALDNLKLAVNHGATEGTNYSTGTVIDTNVTADANTDTSQVFTAKESGSVGNVITTTVSMANGSFASATLLGGTDATAIEFATALTASIVAITNNIIQPVDGGDGTVSLTATTAGVLGNDIVTTTDITGASFAHAKLIGGTDASAANAVDEAKKAINADTLAIVTAVDGTGDVLELTSKVKGADSNLIRTTTTCANATFGADTLEGGITGTPGWEDQIISTSTHLYIS